MTSYIVSVKYPGDFPAFYGPFDGREQAENWAHGARSAWEGAAVNILPLDSPWA